MSQLSGFFDEVRAKLETATWADAYLTIYGLGDAERNLGRFDLTVASAVEWLDSNESIHRDRLLVSLDGREGGLDEIDEEAVAAVIEVAQLFAEAESAGWSRVRLRVRANGGEEGLGRTVTLQAQAVMTRREAAPAQDLRTVVRLPPGEQQPERAAELALGSAGRVVEMTGRVLDQVIRERESDGDYIRTVMREALEAKQSIVEDQRRIIAELRRDLDKAYRRLTDVEEGFRRREDGHVDKVLEGRSEERQAESDAVMAKALSEGFHRTLEKGTALGSLFLMKDLDLEKLPLAQKLMANPALLDVLASPSIMTLMSNAVVVETLTQPHILTLLRSPAFAAICTEDKIPALLAVIESMAANNPAAPLE